MTVTRKIGRNLENAAPEAEAGRLEQLQVVDVRVT